jgi:hypothetical protein
MQKVATSWLELTLLILLVLGGMGLWVLAERQISKDMQAQEPREEDFRQKVTDQQAELAVIQNELATTQEKLLQQRLEVEQLILVRDAQASIHPQLLELSPITTATLLIPAEVLQTYLQTQIDLATTARSVNNLVGQLTTITETVAELATDLAIRQTPPKTVIITQANLSLAQAELAQKQEKLVEQKLKLAEAKGTLNALITKYPTILENSTSIVLTGTLALPPEIMESFADTQLELVTIENLVITLTADVTKLAETVAALSSTLAQAQQATTQATNLSQTQLSLAQAKLSATQEKLIEQQLKLTEQEAAAEAMSATYPQLLTLTDILANPVALSPGTVQTYLDTQLKLAQTQALSQTLAAKQTRLMSRTAELLTTLKETQHSAAHKLNQAQKNFVKDKQCQTLKWAGIYIGVFLLITFSLTWLILKVNDEMRKKINLGLVFIGAALILLLLSAYQMFEIIGAALVGLVILLVMLFFMAQYTKPAQPDPSQETR